MPQERVLAPELEGGLAWLNTDRPLRLADLRGKVVLLDFWTYCCINCLHVLSDLKRLEKKYARELVVIGVHSAKFPNEGETQNIRQAILRYGIEHPVVNDRDFRIWRRYGPRAWPTLVLIDPEGYIVGGISGEGHYELLDRVIGEVVESFRAQGKLREGALSLARENPSQGLLSFPGKVLADPPSRRLFIADSGHNRILIAHPQGQVLDIAGRGEIGAEDGPFDRATFCHPQGMVLDGKYLYVADTGNHLIRRLDLEARLVETIAGTGKQALGVYRRGPARETALSSPWDLVLVGEVLYIAMAGSHQVWAMNLRHREIGPYAGSGREGRLDGPLMQAALAQPSGITTDGKNLYIADSETSSVREVSLNPRGRVSTIVGVDLFEFGDVDGQGASVRLQHPLGIAYHQGVLYVADTYNHKIKVVGPTLGTSATFVGSGRPGHKDGKAAQFYEPGGLGLGQGVLYVADTNNHAVRVVDLSSQEVSTLSLWLSSQEQDFSPFEEIPLARQTLRASNQAQLTLDVSLPPSYKLNPGSPLTWSLKLLSGEALSFPQAHGTCKDASFPLQIPLGASLGQALLQVELSFVYCREGPQGFCVPQTLRWQVPVEVSRDRGWVEIRLTYKVRSRIEEGVPGLVSEKGG